MPNTLTTPIRQFYGCFAMFTPLKHHSTPNHHPPQIITLLTRFNRTRKVLVQLAGGKHQMPVGGNGGGVWP